MTLLRIVALAAGILLIVAGFLGLDRWFYEYVSLALNTEDRPLDRDFYHLTTPFWLVCRYAFGHAVGVVCLFFALRSLHSRGWRAGAAFLVGVTVAALTANGAQAAIGRLRPNQADSRLAFAQPLTSITNTQRVSFPSGEAATAFAMAAVLAYLVRRHRVLFFSAATLTASARLVNGAHYLSDVAAGALLGGFLGYAACRHADARIEGWRASATTCIAPPPNAEPSFPEAAK